MTFHPTYLLFLLLPFAITHVDAQSTPATAPVVVSAMAVARTATKLYIQGGNSTGHDVDQFFSLDLAVPWTVASPAWTQLASGPSRYLHPAAFSADEKTMVVFHVNSSAFAMRYSVASNTWSPSQINPLHSATQGVSAITDPTTGLVYLAAGYTGMRSEMSIYDFEKDTIASGKPLPDPKQIFEARAYYGSVWSKKRESALYFGGYNTALVAADHANIVSEYIPKSETWQAMPTTGEIPSMRADHCMASNDDGTQVVIYGGRLNSSSSTFFNELYVLDTVKQSWAKGQTGPLRIYSGCTIAGDQFILWGGLNGNYEVADVPMLIYDLTKNEWVDKYTPPTSYTKSSSSSKTGAIVGGAVGCVAVLAISALVFIYIRKRRNAARGVLVSNRDDEEGHVATRSIQHGSSSFEASRSSGLRGHAHQDRDEDLEALEMRQGLLLQNFPSTGAYVPQTTYIPSSRSGEPKGATHDVYPSGQKSATSTVSIGQPIYKAQPFRPESINDHSSSMSPTSVFSTPFDSPMDSSARI